MNAFLCCILPFLLFLASLCPHTSAPIAPAPADFRFSGADWGDSWAEVQGKPAFSGQAFTALENGGRLTVQMDETEYFGVSASAALIFETGKDTQTPGLCAVFIRYDEESEEALLQSLSEAYGERKDYYIDKNGVANPLTPPGWASDETVADALTERETEAFIQQLPASADQTRIDAALRAPLVTIRLSDKDNLIEINGNAAAAVRAVSEALP